MRVVNDVSNHILFSQFILFLSSPPGAVCYIEGNRESLRSFDTRALDWVMVWLNVHLTSFIHPKQSFLSIQSPSYYFRI